MIAVAIRNWGAISCFSAAGVLLALWLWSDHLARKAERRERQPRLVPRAWQVVPELYDWSAEPDL